MLRHALGGAVIFISLQHFISPSLDLMLCLSVCLLFYCLLALPRYEGGYLTFVHIETRCVKIIPQRRRLHSCYINVTCKVLKISSNINNRYQPLVSYLGIRLCSEGRNTSSHQRITTGFQGLAFFYSPKCQYPMSCFK